MLKVLKSAVPAEALLRVRARTVSRIDDAFEDLGKRYARLHRKREALAFSLRKMLAVRNTPSLEIADTVVASIAVVTDPRYYPLKIVRQDGTVRIFRRKTTSLVVTRKHGKHTKPYTRPLAVIGRKLAVAA